MRIPFSSVILPLLCLTGTSAFAQDQQEVKPQITLPQSVDNTPAPTAVPDKTPAPKATKRPANSTFPSSSRVKAPADRSHSKMVQLFWKKQEIYDKKNHTLTLVGGARAVRNGISTDADTIIAYMRPKNVVNKSSDDDNLEVYRVEAVGNVHIFNTQDQAWGDHGLYDLDKGVMLLTGNMPRVLTKKYYITAKNLIEYYPDSHISIARGNATVTSTSNKRVTADILEGVEAPPGEKSQNSSTGGGTEAKSLDRAYGWGHVTIRTPTQTAIGDRGVYRFGPELARLVGHVHVTQGQNQNNGSQALVNMKTGVSTMLPGGDDAPVQGLVVPNEAN